MTTKEGRILVVDDNIHIQDSLKQLLKYDFESIDSLTEPKRLPEIIESAGHDVILLDMNFKAGARSGEEGLFWIHEIMKMDPRAIVIMITAYGDIELAVKAIRAGGYDFVQKPWEPEKLIHTIRSALRYKKSRHQVQRLISKQNIVERDIDREFGEILTVSESMIHILNTIKKVAATDANILITGEHGTGKELVARAIHRQSNRDQNTFIKIDLGSIPESLFESELFGHTKGAFTDAREERNGRFEVASGGTLFLDEIANLPLGLQAKLLSALQNRKIIKLGSHKEISIDVRLVSATNCDLNSMTRANSFREDLLYRINTIQIHLPPLREREKDIPLLSKHFLDIYSKKYLKQAFSITKKGMEKLSAYAWPGNIRELSHTMEKAVILNDPPILDSDQFHLLGGAQNMHSQNTLCLADIEKNAICKALSISKGNLSAAARILDISRTTLYSKMGKYDL